MTTSFKQIRIKCNDFPWNRVEFAKLGKHLGVDGIDRCDPGLSECQLGPCKMEVLRYEDHGVEACTLETQCALPCILAVLVQKDVACRNATAFKVRRHDLSFRVTFLAKSTTYDDLSVSPSRIRKTHCTSKTTKKTLPTHAMIFLLISYSIKLP